MTEPSTASKSFSEGFTTLGDPGSQGAIIASLGTRTIGVPDTILDFAACGDWEIRGCSSRGMSHRYLGTPRQDAFAIATSERWVVAAVCDGVSSGSESLVAAETAARSLCKLALDVLSRDEVIDWSAMAQRVSRRVIEEARYRQLVDLDGISLASDVLAAVRDVMSTTAVVAVVSCDPTPDGSVFGQIAVLAGDSGAYRIVAGSVERLIGGKDEAGGFTSGAVRPLPGPTSPSVHNFRVAVGDAVLLVSDGIGDALGNGDTTLCRYLAEAWRTAPPPSRYLEDVNALMRTYDDDRTAVGLWWNHRPGQQATDPEATSQTGPSGHAADESPAPTRAADGNPEGLMPLTPTISEEQGRSNYPLPIESDSPVVDELGGQEWSP